MEFRVVIDDETSLVGLAAATKDYNYRNGTSLSDGQYVQLVMERAAESYGRQYASIEEENKKLRSENLELHKQVDILRSRGFE